MKYLALSIAASTLLLAQDPTPILLELFTSESCSSCPPADKLLEAMDRLQPIPGANLIVLSEHVDYWNQQGWKDPFSSAQFSGRQTVYAARMHRDSGYTPQLIVDGQSEMVGSDGPAVKAAIDKAMHVEKLPLKLSKPVRAGDQVSVHVDVPNLPAAVKGTSSVYLALADSRVQSSVARGENAGKSLQHVAVVRTLIQAGHVKAGDSFSQDVRLAVPAGAGANGLRVVAFVQDQKTGHILGVAEQHL
jgi:hypothetical protein